MTQVPHWFDLPRPKQSTTTFPELGVHEPDLVAYLISHDCTLTEKCEQSSYVYDHTEGYARATNDYTLVEFPEGTSSREIFPRRLEARELITFPDGATLFCQHRRHRHGTEYIACGLALPDGEEE